MVIVERTEDSIIFKVPGTLDEAVVKNIEEYISSLEIPTDQTKDYDPELPFGKGFDKEGFVTDPVVLEISQEVNRAGLRRVKERFKDHPELMALFNNEEEE